MHTSGQYFYYYILFYYMQLFYYIIVQKVGVVGWMNLKAPKPIAHLKACLSAKEKNAGMHIPQGWWHAHIWSVILTMNETIGQLMVRSCQYLLRLTNGHERRWHTWLDGHSLWITTVSSPFLKFNLWEYHGLLMAHEQVEENIFRILLESL